MPFGKYKGLKIRHIPESYLSWLISEPFMADSKWHWLVESIAAEFRHRDLRFELAEAEPIPEEMMASLFDEKGPSSERKVRKESEF